MVDKREYDIARAVVEKHAPDELEYFDELFEDYSAGQADYRPVARQHASGTAVVVELLSGVVLQVVAQVLATRADRAIDKIVERIRSASKAEKTRAAASAIAETIAQEVETRNL